jgi:uncharacterized protein
MAFVIVPGIGGSGEAHWQSLWEQSWGDKAIRIEPPSWNEPVLDDWVAAIERAVSVVEARGDEVVLIAHSLGCWAVSTWLQGAAEARAHGALLVAPPDPEGASFPAASAPTFLEVTASPLPCPSIVIASTNDPYGDVHHAEQFARAWGSDLEVVGEFGHLNAASGLGDWPAGREILARLTTP